MVARTEPAVQHGWFPDPQEPGRLRMWDGKAWTSLTKYPAHEEADLDAAPPTGPAPTGPLPSGAVPTGPPTPSMPAAKPTHVQEAPAGSAAWHRPRPQPGADVADPAGDPTLRAFAAANRFSLITLAVAVVYIVVASAIGFAFVGVLPALLTAYAYRQREKMAPFAALASAATIVIGLVLLAR